MLLNFPQREWERTEKLTDVEQLILSSIGDVRNRNFDKISVKVLSSFKQRKLAISHEQG